MLVQVSVSKRELLIQTNKIRNTTLQTFLLSMYGRSKEDYSSAFLGLYLYEIEDSPKVIFVFKNDEDNEAFKEAFHYLSMHHCFYDHYYDPEFNEIGAILTIDVKYRSDFNCYLRGKYSHFSHDLKKSIERQYGKKIAIGWKVTPYEIIYPSDEKRKSIANHLKVDIAIMPDEVYDPPKLERELFLTCKQLIEKYGTE